MTKQEILTSYQGYLDNQALLSANTKKDYAVYAKSFLNWSGEITEQAFYEYAVNEKRKNYLARFKGWLSERGLLNTDPFQNRNTKTIDELARDFLRHLKLNHQSQGTIESVQAHLKIFKAFLKEKGISQVSRISKTVLTNFMQYLYTKENGSKGHGYSLAYKNLVLLKVKGFFKFLHERGETLYDPSVVIAFAKLPKKVCRDTLDFDEINQLEDEIDTNNIFEYRNLVIIEFLYATALRVFELVKLKIRDIDLRERTVLVRDGKGRKDRLVCMNKYAAGLLGAYLKKVRPKILKMVRSQQKLDYIFLSDHGREMNKHMVSRYIGSYAKKAGLDKAVSAHTLRHSCATHMLQNGADIRYVQKLLGHKNLSATQVYTKVLSKDLKETIQKFHPLEKQ
jgi:integrase/recombinase XerD